MTHGIMKSKDKLMRVAFCTLVMFILFACSKQDRKVVVCWGDSLTASKTEGIKGVAKEAIGYKLAYPERLQDMLSGEYKIINAGVGGESPVTIMARQGAYPMKLAHDVTIYKGKERKYVTFIGNNDIPAFVSSYNGETVTPFIQGRWQENSCAKVNPVSFFWGGNIS